jgi:hypothetical protein
MTKAKKQRRDKWGRFAPKKRSQKLKPYVKPSVRDESGRFRAWKVTGPKPKRGRQPHWRVIQSGKPIEVRAYGYFIVIRALVPGGWQTDSTPAFVTDSPEESIHQIVWRTQTRLNLYSTTESSLIADLRDEGIALANGGLALAELQDREILVLSSELRVLTDPHVSFQVDVWEGITPPKWLRNVKLTLYT